MTQLPVSLVAILLSLAVALTGCGQTDSQPAVVPPPAGEHEHAHEHAAEGPHHGQLIELGKGEYHAELVMDEASGEVTIYVLDGSGEKPLAIEAPDLTVNVTHDGEPHQYKLTASPQEGDAEGKASRFVVTDKELVEHLHHDSDKAQLAVAIEGQPFTGSLEHHDDHDHPPHK